MLQPRKAISIPNRLYCSAVKYNGFRKVVRPLSRFGMFAMTVFIVSQFLSVKVLLFNNVICEATFLVTCAVGSAFCVWTILMRLDKTWSSGNKWKLSRKDQ
jgi:hypothetical protein